MRCSTFSIFLIFHQPTLHQPPAQLTDIDDVEYKQLHGQFRIEVIFKVFKILFRLGEAVSQFAHFPVRFKLEKNYNLYSMSSFFIQHDERLYMA